MSMRIVEISRWKFLLILFVSMSVSAGVIMSMGFVVMLEKLGEASLPELSDSWIVAFDWLALRSLIVAIVFGVVMLLSPIVPLCFRKVKNAVAGSGGPASPIDGGWDALCVRLCGGRGVQISECATLSAVIAERRGV